MVGKYKMDFCLTFVFCFLNPDSQVYVWVLNEEHEYKRAFDLGATGVITDYPTKLKDFLNNFSA